MAVCGAATLQKTADSGKPTTVKPSHNGVTDKTPLSGVADVGAMATSVTQG